MNEAMNDMLDRMAVLEDLLTSVPVILEASARRTVWGPSGGGNAPQSLSKEEYRERVQDFFTEYYKLDL